VAGRYLFFDGYAQRPVGGVTISLWADNCQTEVARQFFPLRGDTYWHGFLVAPRELTGPACAIAYYGEPGAPEEWREALVTVDVLPADDPEASGVTVGYPPPGRTLLAGRSYPVYGTAYNAPENRVDVMILLENGRVLAQGFAAANLFGYWEVSLRLPADAEGPATIWASAGIPGDERYSEGQNAIIIAPASS
jgi:hypothetical protein